MQQKCSSITQYFIYIIMYVHNYNDLLGWSRHISMDVARRRVVNGVTSNSSNKVPIEQLMGLDVCEVPASDDKFAGFKGCSVRALLGAAKPGTTGVFVAGDGMTTDPISFEHLSTGIVMHTDPSGQPLQHGGPLRVWFPPECGLRCSRGNNLAVKDVRSLTLTSTPDAA